MKKTILAAILFATASNAITLDETPYTTGMWSVGDPFGFTTLTNANTRSIANSNEIVVAKAWIAALSNDVDVVKANVSTLSNGLVTANANIAANSNGLVSANANIAAASNGLVSANAAILANSNLTVTGLAGKVATNDVTYTATVSRAASALQPSDTNGWTVSAHQAWLTNMQSGVTLTNFTAAGYFTAANGRIELAPFDSNPGDLGVFSFVRRTPERAFHFFDIDLNTLGEYSFLLDPVTESLRWGSEPGRTWSYPAEGANSIIASRAYVISATSGLVRASITNGLVTASITNGLASTSWVSAYVASNAPSGPGLPTVWTNMTWGATGTNATYRMSWDTSNGTFRVEEILP
jgi:hypothetical protein